MATVKKCDRCGKTYQRNIYNSFKKYDPYPDGDFIITVTHDRHFSYKYDLCDNCLDKLYCFLNNNQDK